jgi:hypothetical protein
VGIVSLATGAILAVVLSTGSADLVKWIFILLSGLPLALALWNRYTFLELLACSVALSLALLSMAAAVSMIAGAFSTMLPELLIIGCAVVIGLLGYGRRCLIRGGRDELYAWLVVSLLVAVLAITYSANGPVRLSDGVGFVVRRWVARDGAYLFALIQQAIERQTLPDENPFMAGVPVYYAVLGHCGLAALARHAALPAALALWPVFPLFHISAVLLVYHGLSHQLRGYRIMSWPIWAAVATVLFVAWRADFFVYPQSQSVFMPLIAWLFWWVTRRVNTRAVLRRWIAAGWVGLLAFVHTVSCVVGLSALAGIGLENLRRDKKKRWVMFVLWMVAFVGIALTNLRIGNAPYRAPLVYPTTESLHQLVGEALPYYPLYLIAIAASVLAWRTKRYAQLFSILLLLSLSVGYTLRGVCSLGKFSQFFAIYNAHRFVYFALLPALPVLFATGKRTRWVVSSFLAGALLLFPPSQVNKTAQLVTWPPIVYSPSDLMLYEAIRKDTPPRADFVTNARHWGLPMFTGRCEFIRDAVPAFGLHALPDEKVVALVNLREAFVTGIDCIKLWQALRAFNPSLEYVLIENTNRRRGQQLLECALTQRDGDRTFVLCWQTSDTAVLKWVDQQHN